MTKLRKAFLLLLSSFGKKTRIGSRYYRVHGFTVNHLAYQGEHEPWMDLAFQVALKSKPGAFVDVGANTGQTFLKLLAIDPEREYFGFEPQADCCFYISRFIKDNGLMKCRILPLGLSNTNGVLTLYKRTEAKDLTASTIRGFRPDNFYSNAEAIFALRGDDIFPQLTTNGLSVVKIDVEGGELEVLEGFGNILSNERPIIFFEVLNHFIIVTRQHINEEIISFREGRIRKMEALLASMRYRIFHIVPAGGVVLIDSIKPAISADLDITNYVAVHDDLKDSFLANMERAAKPIATKTWQRFEH